jgi:NAD(P)-dependent dehydrogenase (short-subunit alcohol dehydrogenase family)
MAGRTVLVTGGSGGIGKATALGPARMGAHLAARGAATSVHLASAPHLEQVTGRYFANSKPRKSSSRSYDQAVAARLWQVSADLADLGTR